MEAIFRKGLGSMGFEMLADLDWDALKIKACNRWSIEHLFDAGFGWDKLRDKRTLIVDDGNSIWLYCHYSEARDDDSFEAFTGEIWDINEAIAQEELDV